MALYESVIIGRQDLTPGQFETLLEKFIAFEVILPEASLKEEKYQYLLGRWEDKYLALISAVCLKH